MHKDKMHNDKTHKDKMHKSPNTTKCIMTKCIKVYINDKMHKIPLGIINDFSWILKFKAIFIAIHIDGITFPGF